MQCTQNICQTVGNVQHHTMTVQNTWKSVCRAGRSADQLLVPNDKRWRIWKWQGMPAISMEDMKYHKNLSKQSGPNDVLRQTKHNCMSHYECIAALYVMYNMSMTIATIHINGSEHYSMDPFLN
jgi:hypothetical protein